MATIKQISELAGVSIGTVDRVLHNRPGVSEKTKDKVLKIAKELGYKSNVIGKALVNQRKPKVLGAVILSEKSGYFNALIKNGMDQAMEEIGQFGIKIKYYFLDSIDVNKARHLMKKVEEDNLSGLIIRPMDDEKIRESINQFVAKGIPVVTCSWDIKNSNRMCFVGHDHYKEGRIAANLLTKIMREPGEVGILCSSYNVLAQRQKITGLTDYLNEKELGVEVKQIVETYNEKQMILEKTLELLQSNPNIKALAIQTSYAEVVCQVVKQLGLERKLIIFHYGLLEPNLLTENLIDFVIEENPALNGYKAVKVLFDKLFYNKEQTEKFIAIESTIKIEESIK
ncbi:LacI family DNA-binding transcriptional regulator [Radiobacillus sp. PE A8.2]|uniref:LacI family DNA-binding transcriptional regulator n=1 Tax=Radiobacillus sp. PE A8.2 TaxID=3380349 RepID=UPI00388D3ADC